MKRVFDICVSLMIFPVAAIPFCLLLVAQFCLMGRPLFFTQERAGRSGQPFRILKLRTMRTGPGSDGERLTGWGHFLRSTSLDELPELWNVLRGDMSLVGPRPLPTKYLPRYSAEEARRHDVRPGITGWAQVNGRNGLSWARQFQLDLWYVDHASFLLDLKILGLTILTVLQRHHIQQPGEATRKEFPGHDRSPPKL